MKIFLDNLGAPVRSSKSRSWSFYLDAIRDLGLEFDKLEAVSTAGDFRPPYEYQWRATTKVRPGEDDPFEGLAGAPLEALQTLYKACKHGLKLEVEEDEEVY